MKKHIDIEKLVQWAICDELPKGQPVAASPWDVITQFAQLGTRIQTGGYRGDGFGFVPGAPHEDALVVAAAVQAIETEARFDRAVEVVSLFGDLFAVAGDGVACILASCFDPRSLVIGNAALRKRPAWRFEHPTPYQMFAPVAAGRPRAMVMGIDADGDLVEVRRNEGRAKKRDGDYTLSMQPRSPLQWLDPAPLQVAECRAEYVAWHAALVSLAQGLAGRLVEFEPLAPAAPLLPWMTGEAPAGRVFRDGRATEDMDPLSMTSRARAVFDPVRGLFEADSAASYKKATQQKMRKVPAV